MTEENNQIKDRVGAFLIPRVEDEYLFDELSDGYLAKAGIADVLSGVPVPIKRTEMSGLSTLNIVKNMAFVIGCDVNFRYRDNYIACISRLCNENFSKALLSEGVDLASNDDYENAIVLFRAALLINPDDSDALYCYGRACRDAYENSEEEEYVGKFKAESLESFEKLTLKAPDFDMGYYFLGFAYVNMGLYVKAKLTWESYLKLAQDGEMKAEVRGLMEKLEEPVKIEEGYNLVLSGRYEEGIAALTKYEFDDRFNTWWPLWHYLGMAYKGLGDLDQAEASLLKVLTFTPSNIDTMQELISIYRVKGDDEKVEKYTKKVEIVKANVEADREEKRAAAMPGLS